jgi:hypothetical protein
MPEFAGADSPEFGFSGRSCVLLITEIVISHAVYLGTKGPDRSALRLPPGSGHAAQHETGQPAIFKLVKRPKASGRVVSGVFRTRRLLVNLVVNAGSPGLMRRQAYLIVLIRPIWALRPYWVERSPGV